MNGAQKKIPYAVTRLAYAWEDDPLLGSEAGKRYAHLRRLVLDSDAPAVDELNAAIAQYPHVPHFRHLLTEHHEIEMGGKSRNEIRDEIAEAFPEYMASILHLAGRALEEEDFEKAEQILGPGCELHKRFPGRRIFHEQEALPYELCAMRVFLGRKEIEVAEQRLDRILIINPDSLVAEIAEPLFSYLSSEHDEGEEEDAEQEDLLGDYSPEAAVKIMERHTQVLINQAQDEPAFRLSATRVLYADTLDPGEKPIQELLAADRADLIHDLELVLLDAKRRWISLQTQYEIPEFIVLHALYLLTEIRATESLEKVLDFFAQHPSMQEFWLGDMIYEDLWEVLYVLGEGQPRHLVRFASEDSHYTLLRCVVPDVMVALLLHQPSRRGEAVTALRELIAAPAPRELPLSAAQAEFLGLAVASCVAGRVAELLPEISRLYAMDLGVEEFAGSLKEVKRQMAEPVAPETLSAFSPLEGGYEARLERMAEVLEL